MAIFTPIASTIMIYGRPEGPGNTVGTTIFLGATMPAKMGPTGQPPGDPEIKAEIPAEEGFIDKLTSTGGIASLAKVAPQFDYSEAQKRFENEEYVYGKTDCSAAVRAVYPEFDGMNSDNIRKHLDTSEDWSARGGYDSPSDGDVLHFPGHVEIVTGRGVDHRGRPSVTTWGCRTSDSQGKNGGCGEAVFSDEYLKKKDAAIFTKTSPVTDG